jgi:hypothetical protein|tara:strand:- start:566 stop:853 length:288 start_codon:yes stop_codon:yes gene_type:complete
MAEPTVKDMIATANSGEPTAFADVFSGVMVDRVNDKVDQIRQAVAAKLGGLDPTTAPAMELGAEEQDDPVGEVETVEDEESNGEETETVDGTDED